MTGRRSRKNPSPPPVPTKRRFAGAPPVSPRQLNSSLARVRRIAGSVNERERPFSPERPGSWRGSSRDLVVNGKRRRMTPNSYELSFSPEFFFAEGEPYDYLGDTKRPVSVWAAIEGMRLDQDSWNDLAREVFGLSDEDELTPEMVMDKIQETNTCSNLSSPVRVWIDPEGHYELRVYDSEYERNGSQTIKGVRLDDFTIAFLEAALWSTNDESREDGGDPLDENYSIDDFTKESLQQLAAECERFQDENTADLAVGDTEQAGHEFWLNRNGHGSGFWDGDWPEPQASRLDEASHRFGEVNLYVQDGEIVADPMRPLMRNARSQRRNGEQQRMPWGSKRAGKFEIPMVEFDWEQVDGDVNLPQYGGIIARCAGGQIDLVEIQPVREYVGDGEAAEVGFPFWTKEASYYAEDLDLNNKEVRAALESSDVNLDEVDDDWLARAIAIACMRYGHGSEEGDGGWAGDKEPGEEGRANLLGSRKVRWGYAGVQRKTFAEEASGDDDDFRREVLGEEDEED